MLNMCNNIYHVEKSGRLLIKWAFILMKMGFVLYIVIELLSCKDNF